jgi:hypothetical protein
MGRGPRGDLIAWAVTAADRLPKVNHQFSSAIRTSARRNSSSSACLEGLRRELGSTAEGRSNLARHLGSNGVVACGRAWVWRAGSIIWPELSSKCVPSYPPVGLSHLS